MPACRSDVRRLDALFEIERAINGRGADERRAVRQEKSKPLLQDMHVWLLHERETLSRSSEVLKPINYMLRRWDDFARFLSADPPNLVRPLSAWPASHSVSAPPATPDRQNPHRRAPSADRFPDASLAS